MREVLIRSPSLAFAFGVQTLHSYGSSQAAHPPSEQSRSGGTGTVTMPASVAGNVDCPDSITVAHPTALTTHVPAVIRFVLGEAGGAGLARIRRVYLLHPDTKPFSLVRDELGELEERPRVLHPVVFAGRVLTTLCPTACACRALGYPPADASESFQTIPNE
jgi:hypothetical protein